jgi:hypothetical protein
MVFQVVGESLLYPLSPVPLLQTSQVWASMCFRMDTARGMGLGPWALALGSSLTWHIMMTTGGVDNFLQGFPQALRLSAQALQTGSSPLARSEWQPTPGPAVLSGLLCGARWQVLRLDRT